MAPPRKIKKKTEVKSPLYAPSKSPSIITTLLLILGFTAIVVGGVVFYNRYPNGVQPTKTVSTPIPLSAVLSANTEPTATPKPTEVKVLKTSFPTPNTTAKSYGIYYREKGTTDPYSVVSEKEAETKLPMASLTKLMTALVAIEKYPLDKVVTIPESCTKIVDGSNVGFVTGESFTLQDLLYGLLVKSGADAGCVIASIENPTDFVAAMNQKAKDLKMDNTSFTNPIGFDAGENHVSTIKDLKILSEEVLKSNLLRKIVSTQIIEVSPQNQAKVYRFSNTNDLLKTIPGTIGIKTGLTENAKECLSYLYEDHDKEILIVLLGSEKRFDDTKALLDWAKIEIDNQEQIN